MIAPVPPLLVGIPYTDVLLQEFRRPDGTVLESNAYAAKDAIPGIVWPYIRTFSQAGTARYGYQWMVMESRKDFVQMYPEARAPGSRKPWSPVRPGEAYMAKQLRDINSLVASIDYAMEATGSCNAAFDMWLLTTKDGGEPEISAEVMVWLAMQGDIRPAGGDTEVCGYPLDATLYRRSLYDAGGKPWPIYTFLPNTKTEVGDVQLGEYLRYLTTKGLVSPDLYATTVEFGNEVIDGEGWCVVNRFEVQMT